MGISAFLDIRLGQLSAAAGGARLLEHPLPAWPMYNHWAAVSLRWRARFGRARVEGDRGRGRVCH